MQDKELKHEFELERIILFSDAVFAIIITIMVLELKLPDNLKGAAPDEVKKVFKELILKFSAYVGSFFLVSSFWVKHLKIFKNLKDYDVPLVARNLFFLFVISLFPFAISTITSGLSFNSYWTVDIYLGIILSGIFAQSLIVQYIVKNKERLCSNPAVVEDNLKWRVVKTNFIIFPTAIIILIILNVAGVFPPAILYTLVFYALSIRLITKRFYPESKNVFQKMNIKRKSTPKSIDATA